MKNDQLTLRLPRKLARALTSRAKEVGLPKSHVVREALEAYLARGPADEPGAAWSRVAPLVGSLRLDRTAVERDALASQLRAHNWRE